MKRKRRVEGPRAAGRAGCSSVVFGSTKRSREDLVARARALLSDAEPAPTPTRVEPADDLDVDMDLIRRARALRGASQLARTESK